MIAIEEREEAVVLMNEINESVVEVSKPLQQLLDKQKNGELNMSKGISFLDVKNHQMLSYLINLIHLMYMKTSGQSIQDLPDIDRLVEIRTVLEKMRPIEQKLKYQIDKLVQIGHGIEANKSDPLRLKPNPANLISKLGDESQSELDEDNQAEHKPQAYKAAKLIPMFYDGDETVRQKQDKQLERAQKRMMNNAEIRDLYRERTDAPEEIIDFAGIHRVKEGKLSRERQEYEEKYFVRKSLTKKERNAEKRIRTMSEFNDVMRFPDFSLFGAEKNKKQTGVGSQKRSKKHLGPKGLSNKRRKT